MTAVRHGKGIHCIHTYGWQIVHWCQCCRNHLHNTAGDEKPVSTWARTDFEAYERERDINLAYALLSAMADGEIPIAPLLADAFDLTNVFEARVPEPSAN
jgi:hypothetical protein